MMEDFRYDNNDALINIRVQIRVRGRVMFKIKVNNHGLMNVRDILTDKKRIEGNR